jgi:hypothetical protein
MKRTSTLTGLVTAAMLALPAGALAVPADSHSQPVKDYTMNAATGEYAPSVHSAAPAPPTWPVNPQLLTAPRVESSSMGQPSPGGDGTGTLLVVLIAGGAAAAAGCTGYAIARMPRMRGQHQSVVT